MNGENIEKKLRSFIKTDGKKLYKKLSRKSLNLMEQVRLLNYIKKLNNKF